MADRILGSQFLEDIAEFFLLFQTMYDGFVERAKAVTRTLDDKRTTFVVVSTLESAPVREAEFFIDALDERGPPPRRRRAQQGAARRGSSTKGATGVGQAPLRRRRPTLAGGAADGVGRPEQVDRVLHEVGESFLNFQVVAKREAETRAELAAAARGRRHGARTSTATSTTSPACSGSGEQIWR